MDNSQILESLLLTGTPQDAAAFFKSHRESVNAGRALAIACRFCGLEYVKALVESGAAFEKPYSSDKPFYWLAPLKFYENQYEVYRADEDDDCFEIKNERKRAVDNSVETFHLLPEEQRAEIVKYLCENSERVNFEPGELLFFSIMSNNRIITARLKEMGVTFSEKRIRGLTESTGFMCIEFIEMLTSLNDDDIVSVICDVVGEVGGKRLCFYETVYSGCLYSLYSAMGNRFFKLEFFRVFLENFKLTENRREGLLKNLIADNCPGCLAQCAERGWLRQLETCDEMIAYASEVKSTECTAWLFDYKNRNFDLAAERAKAEKKVMHELNAPYSIAALKNIWSWRKQEDGTLVIFGYRGTDTVINVPPQIGRRAVTAIGGDIFIYGVMSKIRKVVLPNGIRSIGKGTFSYYRRLEELVLPDSVIEIGVNAFTNCRNLKEINIPSSVKEIGNNLFYGCGSLCSVKLPAGIKRIGKGAFERCYALKEITVPEGTVEIGKRAFARCRTLKTVVIPASVRVMGDEIFTESDVVTVIVEPGSYSEEYCRQNNIPFKYGSDEKG